MQLVSEVGKLKRERAKAKRRRERTRVAPPRDPGRLLDFVTAISPHMMRPRWLAPIAEQMERIPLERIELCFSVPPRYGKSSLMFHLVAWLLTREPRLRILYVTYAQTFAEEQIAHAKTCTIAAGVTLGERQTQKVWTTRAGGSVTAAGMDGQLAGRGFHVVICDDPHKNVGDAHSRRIREAVLRGFRADVWTRKTPRSAMWPGTSFVVLHTRWHPDDLIGTLSASSQAAPWHLINLPAIQPDGSALAPELWSIEDVERERQIGEYEFSALHLGQPRPIGGTIFGDVATIDTLGSGGTYRYAIGIDIARSARTRSDYSVAVVMRIETSSRLIDVVDVAREQGTIADRVTGRGDEPIRAEDDPRVSAGFLRTLHRLTKKYPGAPVVMYGAKDETLLVALMGRHEKYPVRVRHTLATAKKWIRAQPYAHAWSDPRGRLRVLRTASWFDEFIREHLNFTGADHDGERDDQVDAAAAAFDALQTSTTEHRPRGTGQGSEAARIARNVAI